MYNKQVNYTQDCFQGKQKSCLLGRIRTHDTLQGERSATSATSATQLVTSFRVAVHRYRGIWENPTFGRLDGLASLAN